MNLLEQIIATEAKLAQLRQQLAAAPCAEVGHRWKHVGGANAGCGPDCGCSVPVHRCEACGDCDYGENEEAREKLAACAAERAETGEVDAA
ncbi:hypothetical protein [Azospirillum sp. Sh1]|uniref:hypothetical protein n=1 Tax=Azospirillum sp. Sh1 TaxID=2607285 RepID=UPI0011ECCDA8|nr:hypothetical protein [Azospirillum sp. Sh1]KAA0571114.1 hypothetical protein FZ029_28075 [Azospirillum sp. Sh1]